jgi:TP901 family phage tail tape measure protein
VAGDVRSLSKIQELGLRRNQLAIQQGNLMRQQRRALNELESVTSGRRFIQAQREKQGLLDKQVRTQNALKTNLDAQRVANMRLAAAETAGMKKRSIGYKQLQLNARRLTDQEGALRTSLRGIPTALTAWEQRMVSLKQRASVLNSELATTSQRIGQLAAQQMALNKQISAARWERFQVAGRTIAHLGRVAQLTGLVMAAGIGLAADAAAKFSTQVTLVATQTGKAGSGINVVTRNAERLNQIILRQMPQSIATTEDLTSSTYDLFSSVDSARKGYLSLADGAKLLNLANKASIAGQTDLATAVESIIRPMNTFGFTAKQMPAVLNRMFAAVRFGQLTFGQFASTLQTTAPAAKAANQTFDTLSGTMAFLSRRLGDTRAAIGFARLTEIFGREKFVSGLKKFNVNITNAQGKLLQMPDIIDKLVTRFPKLQKGGVFLQQFFKNMSGTEGTIQARRAFVFLAQQLDQYSEMVDRVSKDNVEFDRSFQALNQTAGVKWAKFMNNLRALMLQFGAAAIPALLELVKPVQRLVEWFGNLDEETRGQIGRWAAYGAAILLVGGTLAAVVGTLVAAASALGGLGLLFPTLIVAALAFAAAARAIQGDWSGVGDLLKSVFDKITSSWLAAGVAGAVILATIFKIIAAVKALQAATLAASGAARVGGATGLLGALFAAVGVATGVGILAVAVAGLGVALYSYSKNASDAAKHTEEMARAQANLRKTMIAPSEAAVSIGNIPISVRDVQRARLDVKDLNREIATLRKQLKQAPQEQKAGLQSQIQRAILDRADAYDRLGEAATTANMRIRGFNRFLEDQATIFDKIASKQRIVDQFQKILALPRPERENAAFALGFTPEALAGQVQRLTANINDLRGASQNASNALVNNFTKMVRSFQQAELLPKNISQDAIGDILKLSEKIGRMPNLKEMRLFFKAEVDPKSLADLPAQVQRFIRSQQQQRAKVKVAADLSFQGARLEHIAQMTGKVPKIQVDADNSKAKQEVNAFKQWFGGNNKIPPFHISSQPSGVALGTAIKSGVLAGVAGLGASLSASLNAQIDAAIAAAQANLKSGSPSKVTADKIGKPMMQGVIVGIISEFGNLKRSAFDSAKEWQKAWEQAFQDAKKSATDFLRGYYDDIRSSLQDTFFSQPFGDLNQIRRDFGVALNVKDLTADLKANTKDLNKFDNQWDKLLKKGAPLKLLQQLQAMGEDGTAILSSLAGASNKDLKRYIKAWKQAQKALNQIAKQQLKQQVKEWKKMGKAIAAGIMLGIKDQSPKLMHFLRNIFLQMFHEAQHTNKSKSPSKLYAEEGKNMMMGLQMGMDQAAMRMPAVGGARLRGGGFRHGGQAPFTQIIHAHHDESLSSTLRRATFRMKHRP